MSMFNNPYFTKDTVTEVDYRLGHINLSIGPVVVCEVWNEGYS